MGLILILFILRLFFGRISLSNFKFISVILLIYSFFSFFCIFSLLSFCSLSNLNSDIVFILSNLFFSKLFNLLLFLLLFISFFLLNFFFSKYFPPNPFIFLLSLFIFFSTLILFCFFSLIKLFSLDLSLFFLFAFIISIALRIDLFWEILLFPKTVKAKFVKSWPNSLWSIDIFFVIFDIFFSFGFDIFIFWGLVRIVELILRRIIFWFSNIVFLVQLN